MMLNEDLQVYMELASVKSNKNEMNNTETKRKWRVTNKSQEARGVTVHIIVQLLQASQLQK